MNKINIVFEKFKQQMVSKTARFKQQLWAKETVIQKELVMLKRLEKSIPRIEWST